MGVGRVGRDPGQEGSCLTCITGSFLIAEGSRQPRELFLEHLRVTGLNHKFDPWIIIRKVRPLVLNVQRSINENRNRTRT